MITKNLFKKKWDDIWVSKSDIVEYFKCPYRVFVAHSENKSMDDFKSPDLIHYFLDKGLEFENSVINNLPFNETESVDESLYDDCILHVPVLFKNNKLGIMGIVDLIKTENGKL